MSINSKIKKIVITGGSGYIGSTLVNQIPEFVEVVIIDNFHIDTPYKRTNRYLLQKQRNVKIIEANTSDSKKYTKYIANTDVIVYMASLNSYKESNADPQLYLRENALSLQLFLNTILSHAEGLKKCILTSSRGVYGEGPYHCNVCKNRVYPYLSEMLKCTICGSFDLSAQLINEDNPANPSSYYGLSKKFQEDILTLFCIQNNISLDIFRIFNVYGEDQGKYYSNIGIIPQIFNQIYQDNTMYLNGNGSLTRDFVDVKDVIKVLTSSVFSDQTERQQIEIYNVGSGNPMSIKDIADFFESAGYTFKRNYIVNFDDIKYSVADNTKVLKHFKLGTFNNLTDFLKTQYTK